MNQIKNFAEQVIVTVTETYQKTINSLANTGRAYCTGLQTYIDTHHFENICWTFYNFVRMN